MENPENSQSIDENPPYEESEPTVAATTHEPTVAAMADEPAPPPAGAPPLHPPAVYSAPAELPPKSPILAAFLSILPGLGNIYNGLYRRGVTFFLAYVALFGLALTQGDGPHLAFLIPCTVFTWFFNVFDAYRQAILINYGYRDDVDGAKLSMKGWGLVPGIVLVAVGVYGILDQYFDISWDLLFDQWPWLLILGGGGLIAQHYRERVGTTDEV